MNKNTLCNLGLLLAFSLLLAAQSAAASQARHALIIGNSAYKQTPLDNPQNDAKDLAAVLKKLGFKVILETNADIGDMESALAKYTDRLKRSRGVGLLYYAGHGVQAGGENYLIPVKANIQRGPELRRKAMSLSQIMEELTLAGNGFNMVVLDACRDNPYKGKFRSGTRGLGRVVNKPEGTLLAFATDPGDVAADGDGRNSPFTRHLIKAIQQPGQDVELMFKRVRSGVYRETSGNQTPWMESSLLGDFYFVEGKEPVRVAAIDTRPPPAPSPDRQAFEPALVKMKGGCFQMGSPESEKDRYSNERQHRVCVDDFRLGKTEVTVGQFRVFVDTTGYRTKGEKAGDDKAWRKPGFSQGEDHPVVYVSWNDAIEYTEWLSEETGKSYRLPSEAEWEYAARAGSRTTYPWGNSIGGNKANCYEGCGDSHQYTAPVGSFSAYGGLHDMNGNVFEWTCSKYDKDYEGDEKECTSKNDASGRRALRGGSWFNEPWGLRSANRFRDDPTFRYFSTGFRVARTN